jgi:hypothetical protein
MNSIVALATVHLKKIAAKSQEVGKANLAARVLQQIVSRRSKGFAFALCDILLAFRRHNFDGGATSGPQIEAQCTGGMRRFCICWRGPARRLLSFKKVQRQKPSRTAASNRRSEIKKHRSGFRSGALILRQVTFCQTASLARLTSVCARNYSAALRTAASGS